MTTNATAHLAADVVLLAEHDGELYVLLVQRGWPPFEGLWAIPGGHLDEGEDAEVAGRRELVEETGLATARLDLVGVYGAPGRDPRGRYVTWAFVARLDHMHEPTAGDDARAARWFLVDTVLASPASLAFDHHQILTDAVALVRTS
ncbi:NUDIX hydrolase [Kutzneria buriramensis]|uniref:8-oxo-dGTP diphosphatase n=1 Tax=Kutzneria buriramensis TaxID=1045776 RepID=A0A3E0G6B4_9PSEU|nr:NUDIX hydrolase [Kutzneria buriramensis]REH18263.1 8-oxo-dGTP diphosphatase [Kutzneria buriramensis]